MINFFSPLIRKKVPSEKLLAIEENWHPQTMKTLGSAQNQGMTLS